MKSTIKKLGFVFTGVVLISVLSCSTSETKQVTENATEINAENVVVADYSVDGMVCAMGCAKTIQDELANMNGIAACNVDFEEGKAHVEYDKTQLSENDVIAVIEGLADGKYKVKKWVDKATELEVEESEENEDGAAEVTLPTIEIPNLFSLLFNQL